MKLSKVTICNYRSIEELSVDLPALGDGSATYGLIGVNEAGKSSILRALALKDKFKNSKGQPLPLQKEFRDSKKPVTVAYGYELSGGDLEEIKPVLLKLAPTADASALDLSRATVTAKFLHASPSVMEVSVDFPGIPKGNAHKAAIEAGLLPHFTKNVHRSVFWTAEDRFLISNPIAIPQFVNDPDTVSIPLKNSFALAGIVGNSEIKSRLERISDSTEREHLQNELGQAVTGHIKAVWQAHPIRVTFNISDNLINFHVHDLNSRGKAKTADQRSDGFGQFVSFLLTVSAQNRSEAFANTILLIDEPETHLHPRAQEDLLQELIKITRNGRNNVALFATHSNYMIDRADLSRNYKISKPPSKDQGMEKTVCERFDQKVSTYAGVTFEVFDIASADYHNELYSSLHVRYMDAAPNDDKRERIKEFDDAYFGQEKKLLKDRPWKTIPNSATLPTHIRNCIHHPDNGGQFSEVELRDSIDKMRGFLGL